jgi:hypothetical protein
MTALVVPFLGQLADAGWSQQPNSGESLGPSQNVQQPAPTVAPPEEHLFGDWGGAGPPWASI